VNLSRLPVKKNSFTCVSIMSLVHIHFTESFILTGCHNRGPCCVLLCLCCVFLKYFRRKNSET
jgi:hypothetical protein